MNIDQILNAVHLQCGEPDIHRPSEDQKMLSLRKVAQGLHNEVQTALPGWSLGYVDVTAGPSDTNKSLSAIPSLSKVRRIYALDSSGSQYSYNTPVKLIDVDELSMYQGGAAIAEVAAPYFREGIYYLQFAPELSASYRYRVWYETGAIDDLARGSVPLPQQDAYHFLLADLMTIDILPRCWWSWLLGKEVEMAMGDQRKLMKMHADELARPILMTLEDKRRTWKDHISTIWTSQEPHTNAYCDDVDPYFA